MFVVLLDLFLGEGINNTFVYKVAMPPYIVRITL